MALASSAEHLKANTKQVGDCLEWLGECVKGRGRVRFHGKKQSASRVMFALWNNVAIESVPVVRHTCDNPLCINPEHLISGTQADNVKDMWERGRATILAGERNGRAKLTQAIADEIRRLYVPGKYRHGAGALARKFGVSKPVVQGILSGELWKGAA
jgi:hypothetical protein